MKKIWLIANREYKAYFTSPVAYVVAAVLLLVIGIIFAANVTFSVQNPGQVPSVDLIIGNTMSFMLIFTLPAITMRLVSDEVRLGTIEVLLTAPVRDWEVIVGKWLGAMFFIITVIVITFVYPIMINAMVEPGIEQGLILTTYLALLLMSSAFIAIGLLISSLFENQVATFIATMGTFMIVWFLMGIPAQVSQGTFGRVMSYLNFRDHFDTMLRGIVGSVDVAFFISVTIFFLVLGTYSLESRRWR